MLRFAGLPFALATAPLAERDLSFMALQDPAATLRWLDATLAELQAIRRLVAAGDRDALTARLQHLDIQRDVWINQRAKNVWQEQPKTELEDVSLAGTMLGALGRRKRTEEQ
jgi:hypothetical protein